MILNFSISSQILEILSFYCWNKLAVLLSPPLSTDMPCLPSRRRKFHYDSPWSLHAVLLSDSVNHTHAHTPCVSPEIQGLESRVHPSKFRQRSGSVSGPRNVRPPSWLWNLCTYESARRCTLFQAEKHGISRQTCVAHTELWILDMHVCDCLCLCVVSAGWPYLLLWGRC